MNIEPIPWLRVGAFVREKDSGEVYRITDCPDTVALRDIGGEEVELKNAQSRRHPYLMEFLREFRPARRPKDWQEPQRPERSARPVAIRGYTGRVTT